MQYLICGAGPAGTLAAESLRRHDPTGRITLLCGEPEPPYSRMAIPYLLTGRIDEAGTHLRKDAGHYARLGVELRQGVATAIDTAARTLLLDDGQRLPWDRLLIATGSRPLRPSLPGMDLAQVQTCWTLADARRIAERAQPGSRVVLIGAGFIGCIVLEALALRGVALTVLEMGERMVPRMMNSTAGGLIQRWCEQRGVVVRTAARVTAIGEQAQGVEVALADGERFAADLVICAAGVAPNLEFLAGSGILTDRGILVDDRLQTSVEGIYAAGDVAQGRDFSTGESDVHAIQPTASEHGRVAAMNMAGVDTVYRGSLGMNVLETLGLVSVSFGRWAGAPGGASSERLDAEAYRYLQLQFEGDCVVGATAVGHTAHIGVLRGLIQGRVALGPWYRRLLEDPTQVMEAWLARHAAA